MTDENTAPTPTVNDAASASERSYVAFISYRHSPLDREAAERVQKKIENYIVPKEFRDKVGGKKLGLCFRDEDELPASSSLTNSIYYALDHTQFLIVICTPDLPRSKWCEAEIKYFLKTHDRDHILAVLADGDPSESFSPYMLHTYDEDGNITGDTEPLAANIAGENHTINNKAFKKEIVRLYAALIGCPFDELWQRERRARTNRLLSLAGAAVVVMAVFLGVVLNRNAKIQEQNDQIMSQNAQILAQNDQISEQYNQIQDQNAKIEEQNINLQTQLSSVLVDSGLSKLKDHDIIGALQDGTDALENDDPTVYDHRAVGLLSDALAAYRYGSIQSAIVYEHSQPIEDLAVTDDEKFAIWKDTGGNLSCLDLETYQVQWQINTMDSDSVLYTEAQEGRILYKSKQGLYCHSITDGSLLWSYEHQKYCGNYIQAISEDGSIFAVADHFGENSYGPDNPVYIVFLNTENGKELGRTEVVRDDLDPKITYCKSYGFAAAFSSDNKTFACILPGEKQVSDSEKNDGEAIFVIDMKTFDKTDVGILKSKPNMFYGMDVLSGGNDLFFAAYSISFGGVFSSTCIKSNGDYEFNPVTTDHSLRTQAALGVDDTFFLSNDCHFLSNKKTVLVFSDDDMFVFERDTNRMVRSYALDGSVVNAYWTDSSKKSFEIFTSEGTVLKYDLGTQYLFDRIYALESFDQTGILRSQPVKGGILQNDSDGKYLTVGGDEQNRVLLAQNVTDPHIKTFSFPNIKNFSYLSGVNFLPNSETCFYFYNDENALTFNRKTGKIQKSAHFDQSFSLTEPLPISEDQFIADDQVYSMDGTVSKYGEPFYANEDPTYPSQHTQLADGSVLSYEEVAADDLPVKYESREFNAKDLFGPYPAMILAWQDGNLIQSSKDPAHALILRKELFSLSNTVFTAGKSGLIVAYGRRVRLENDQLTVAKEDEFHLYDPLGDTIATIPNRFPDSGEFTVVAGNITRRAAVLYDDGNIGVYSADNDTAFEPDHHYTAGEVASMCFSQEDDYLVIITISGRLDLYDTDTLTLVHSQTIEPFRDYISGLDGTFTDSSMEYSADKSRLILFACTYCLVLDPESWTIDTVAEDVLAYDAGTNQFYMDGAGSNILTCPFYSKSDLKEWALNELAQ